MNIIFGKKKKEPSLDLPAAQLQEMGLPVTFPTFAELVVVAAFVAIDAPAVSPALRNAESRSGPSNQETRSTAHVLSRTIPVPSRCLGSCRDCKRNEDTRLLE